MSTSDHTGSGAVSGEAVEALAKHLFTADDRAPLMCWAELPNTIKDDYLEDASIRLAALACQPTPVCASVEGYVDNRKEVMPDVTEPGREGRASGKHVTRPQEEVRASGGDYVLVPRVSDAGGDLGELRTALSLLFDLVEKLFEAHLALPPGEAEYAEHVMDQARNALSASSPPAVAGGADREEIARIIDPSAAGWWAVGTHDGTAFDCGFARRWHEALAKADAILALTPRPASPGAQAQSPDLGAGARATPTDCDPGRCEVCDWPLADGPERGCVPGNCSYRPEDPAEQRRIDERRAALRTLQPTDAPIPESGEERS